MQTFSSILDLLIFLKNWRKSDLSIISLITDCNKKWCTLESGFLSYYENDKTTTPNGMIDINEVICLVVHKSDFFLNRG